MIRIDEKRLEVLPAGSQHLMSSEWMGSVNTICQTSGTWRLEFSSCSASLKNLYLLWKIFFPTVIVARVSLCSMEPLGPSVRMGVSMNGGPNIEPNMIFSLE